MSKPKHRASFAEYFLGKKNEHVEEEQNPLPEDTIPPQEPDAHLPPIEENESQPDDEHGEEKELDAEDAEEDVRKADSDDDDPLPPNASNNQNIVPPMPPLEPRRSTNSDSASLAPVGSVSSAGNKSASTISNQNPQPAPSTASSVAPVKEDPVPAYLPKPLVNIPLPVTMPLTGPSITKPIAEEKKIAPPAAPAKPMSERELINNLQQDLRLCEKLATEDRIGEAYFLLKNIENYLLQLSQNVQDQIQRLIDSSAKIRDLRKDGEDLKSWLDLGEDKSVWNAWNTSMGPNQDVSVYTHRDEKDGEYFFKIEGHMNCSLIEAIATILENDLHKLWMPMCTNSEVLATVNNFQRIIRTNVDFVLLKKTAATLVRGDVLPDGKVMLSMKPLEDKPDNKAYLTKDPKQRIDLSGCIILSEEVLHVEDVINDKMSLVAASKDSVVRQGLLLSRTNSMKVDDIYNIKGSDLDSDDFGALNPIGGSAKKISPTRTKRRTSVGSWFGTPTRVTATSAIKVQLILRADLLIDFIPDWIFNLAVRSSISMLIPMMEHQTTFFKDDGYYQKRLVEQRDLYEELEKRINSYKKK